MKNNTEQIGQDFLQKCLRKWYIVLPFIIAALAFAKYMLSTEQTIWNVTGSIIVQEDNSGGGSPLPEEAIIQGLPFSNKGNLDRQIEILKSRRLMERVVDSLGLDIIYFWEDRFKNIELYKNSPVKVASVSDMDKAYGNILRVKMMDESRFTLYIDESETNEVADTFTYNYGVPFNLNGVTFSLVRDTSIIDFDKILRIQFIDPIKVATWFSKRIMFQKKGMSNVLKVSMDDSSPEKMIEIIYKLVEVYNIYVQEEKNKIASRSLNFINDRLSGLSSELFNVEGSKANFQSYENVTTNIEASADQYIQKINTADKALDEINNTKVTLDNIEKFLNDPANKYEPIPGFDLAGISFSSLISSYNRVINGRSRKLLTAKEAHPEIQAANESLAKMRKSLLSGIRLARSEISSKESTVREKVAPVKAKVARMPYVEKKLNEIGRQKSVKEELVIYMLQKREETAIGLATEVDNTQVLDAPLVGARPVGPNSAQYYILALLVGLALPVSFIYAFDRMNNKISSKKELKALSAIPFIGQVAYSKKEENKLIQPETNTVVAEMFRLIRTNLMFLMTKGQKSVMMVTSNQSGDGKTFISTNLGIALSLLNKKTIIIELDLRKPKMTERLIGQDGTSLTGMTNYLVGECNMDKIIRPVEGYPYLDLISSGPTPPNPAELITGDRMVELIDQLKEEYEYIVIDTPPIGLVADAFLLDKVVTNSIFVVRANKTKRAEIRAINDLAAENKLVHPSIILNGTKMPKRYGYYYGAKYGVYGDNGKVKKSKSKKKKAVKS
ncbi:MAG TPA: polysaccharide biosynthesis tyrosine autokinase [Bacteroidetes bacterium]|nr:polysaccharide biosynthesis tyrosine autokinase [Bacteroidota bacterium]